LVMSLWNVEDQATQKLMTDLYTSMLDPQHPLGAVDALRAAQLKLLVRNRAEGDAMPQSWAAFIAAGGR
ncbi:MAG: CHAT domain-containing protein, partial [Proteobacteria bacterium]|nr:CHAT domain-containing protein [Pseudomonadota bacterium]